MSRRAWVVLLAGVAALVPLGAAVAPEAAHQRPATANELRDQLATERRSWDAERRRMANALRHDPTVQEALTLGAVVYGVPRADLAHVAWCESTLRPWARNGQYLGIMQLGDGFWGASRFNVPGLSRYSPYANVLAAAEVVARQGWRQWACRP